MQDRITRLCTKLIGTERPDEIHPVARELQRAIHDHVDRVRESAEFAFLEHIGGSYEFTAPQQENEH